MSKSSFTVHYKQPHKPFITILGVTSIFPNLNGVLINTENRLGHQIESHQMCDNILCGMSIEYSTDEEIEEYFQQKKASPDMYIVIDGREQN